MRAAIWRESRAFKHAHSPCKEKNAAAQCQGESSRSSRAVEIAPKRRLTNTGSAVARQLELAHPRFQRASRWSERTGCEWKRFKREETRRSGKSPESGIHGLGFARSRPGKSRQILRGARHEQNARGCVAPNSLRRRSRGW